MADEKALPPAYNVREQVELQKTPSSRSLTILAVYACLVTVAMVILAVLLPLHLKAAPDCPHVQPSVITYENNYIPSDNALRVHYDKDHQEDLLLDVERHLEVNHYRGEGYGNDSMIVIDYNKRLMALYDDEKQYCCLVGGVTDGPELPDQEDLQALLQQKSDDRDSEETRKQTYFVDKETRIENPAGLLPNEILNKCWGKPVYWARKGDADVPDRQKRACSRRVRCFYDARGEWGCFATIECTW